MTHEDLPSKLPEDLDAEKSILATLATCLGGHYELAEAHEAMLMLRPEHFVHPHHRMIFEAMLKLYHGGGEIGLLTIKATLDGQNKLEQVGGLTGIGEILMSEMVGDPMILATRLCEVWKSRDAGKTGAVLARKAFRCFGDPSEIIAEAMDALSKLSQDGIKAKITSRGRIIERARRGEAFCAKGTEELARFGLPSFDEAIEASAEHVVIVAARPSVGKSAIAIQVQWETALKGIPSLLISLEMNEDETDSRTGAWFTGQEQRAFRSGKYSHHTCAELESVQAELDMMHEWVHPSGVPWSQIEAAIRDAVRKVGVRVVLIDHLTLIAKPDLGKNANDAACWTSISRSVKRLAQELKICFVNICQLNRAGEGVEPKLSDLKETGGWEEDANAVIMLYPKDPKATEDVYAPKKAVLAKVAKNRSGSSGWRRELDFFGAQSRFVEVVRETEPNKPTGEAHTCIL
jgi:replicative DNA helicase